MTADSSAAHSHPEPNYIKIWVLLGILTVVEIGVIYLPITKLLIGILLVGMALAKAILVAAYFMHLKFEVRTLAMVAATPLVLCTFLVLMLLPDAM